METKRVFDVEICLTTDDDLYFRMPNKYLQQGEVTLGKTTLAIEPNTFENNSKIYFHPFFGSHNGNSKTDFVQIMTSMASATGKKCKIDNSGDWATIYSIIADYDLPGIAAEMKPILNAENSKPIYGLFFKGVPEDIILKSGISDAKVDDVSIINQKEMYISDIFITDQDGTSYEIKDGTLAMLPS